MSDTAPLVEARGVGHRYRTAGGRWSRRAESPRVLRDVSIRVDRGETVGLIGESGSGKSTLGRILAHLQRHSEGSVLIEGRDVATLRGDEARVARRRTQMVFQNPYGSVNRRFTIREVLADPLRVNGLGHRDEWESRSRALLERVNVPVSVLDRYPHQLSGGQLQRVCVARTLILDPAFVVADEPTASLDMTSAVQVVDLLAETSKDLGLGLLFISHDLSVVARVADRIAVMYQGSIVEEGPAQQILEQPRHPYTQALRAAVPSADPTRRRRERIRVEPDARGLEIEQGCRFTTRCPLRIDVCDTVTPALTTRDGSRRVACHLVGADGRHVETPYIEPVEPADRRTG